MTVAAPPQPPPVNEAGADDPSEALIKEAKQRARRRRWTYGGTVVVVAIAAVAAFTIPGSPSSHHAARPVPAPPAPTVAPLVPGPDAASTILASWGKFHVGYAFVYADGRVIWQPDGGVFLDADGRVTGPGAGCCSPGDRGPRPEYVPVERRLSARGVELVRTGKLDPKRFLVTRDVDREGRISIQFGTIERKGLWAEPTARVYEPSKFAICPSSTDGTLFGFTVPAPAWALLDGKLRTYDPSIGTASWSPSIETAPMDCFEVTAAGGIDPRPDPRSERFGLPRWCTAIFQRRRVGRSTRTGSPCRR